MPAPRIQRTYDPHFIRLVQTTGDITLATREGVPRSTASGWLRAARRGVVTAGVLGNDVEALTARVIRLERRVRQLLAVLRLLVALLQVLEVDLARRRIPRAADKGRLLRAIERSRGVLGLTRALRLIGLSPSRLSAWRRAARACELDDASSCPLSSPQGLTVDEIAAMREMTTSTDFRHVATSRLALLAQRTGRVVASPSTWCRYVRERGWRRPRGRVHPKAPHEGIRATRPDEIWHIDTTLIRLLDGTRAYLHAVIDNYSRRILAWRISSPKTSW